MNSLQAVDALKLTLVRRKLAALFLCLCLSVLMVAIVFGRVAEVRPVPILKVPKGKLLVCYDWLSRTQLLYITLERHRFDIWCKTFDGANRPATQFAGLPHTRLKELVERGQRLTGMRISPSGDWVLFEVSGKENYWLLPIHLGDGKGLEYPPIDPMLRPWCLLPDNRIALFSRSSNEAVLLSLDGDRSGTKFKIPIRVWQDPVYRASDNGILSVEVDKKEKRFTLLKLGTEVTAVPIAIIPEVSRDGLCPSFSTDGQKYSWFERRRIPIIHRFLYPLGVSSSSLLYVADLRSMKTKVMKIKGFNHPINTWVPGTNMLSFEDSNTLYVVALP